MEVNSQYKERIEMTTIFHPSHAHFLVHKAFIDGRFANPDNPPVVQWYSEQRSAWLETESSWNMTCKFRIKPRTITRTVTYPEPLREAPNKPTVIWMVGGEYDCPQEIAWVDSGFKSKALKNGMVFATEADAQQCYDALFGEQK